MLILMLLVVSNFCKASEYIYDYIFFDNSIMNGNYYYSSVSYDSPSWIKNSRKKLIVNQENYLSPGNSLELTYLSSENGSWSAEVQYKPLRGNDFFSKPDNLTFWFFSEKEISTSLLPLVAFRLSETETSKFVAIESYVRVVSKGKWQEVTIPLKDFGLSNIDDSVIKSLKAVIFKQNGVSSVEQRIFIDDIELLSNFISEKLSMQVPKLTKAKAYERHVDLSWEHQASTDTKYYRIYRSFNGKDFQPIAIQRPYSKRFSDFVGEPNLKVYYRIAAVNYRLQESPLSEILFAETCPMTDEQLLDMIQEAHFRYYWDGAEPTSGLARENIPGRSNMIATGASGFGIMAIIAATERGFITRDEAVERFERITAFLNKADKYYGAVSHFIDGTSGKTIPFFGPKDNGGDLVETSFLAQGLLAAHQYFNKSDSKESLIRKNIDSFWKNIEWSWYKQFPDSPFLYWHWSPDQAWTINHRLIGWNETMITYLLAIMSPTHAINPQMYYSGWASPKAVAQEYRKNWGQTDDGSMYTNGKSYYGLKLDVGVSNGGPLFFVHYSYFGLNPHHFTDKYTNYFKNNQAIARINYRYCTENPGKYTGYGSDCWGLTASDFAWNYQAQEPILSRDNGTIAPTGALASFPYTPKESMDALKNYYRNYGHFLWGEFGFRDAFNLSENWCSPIFMGLNQAPITIMIENYRSNLLWNLFMSHPDVKMGIEKITKLSKKNEEK